MSIPHFLFGQLKFRSEIQARFEEKICKKWEGNDLWQYCFTEGLSSLNELFVFSPESPIERLIERDEQVPFPEHISDDRIEWRAHQMHILFQFKAWEWMSEEEIHFEYLAFQKRDKEKELLEGKQALESLQTSKGVQKIFLELLFDLGYNIRLYPKIKSPYQDHPIDWQRVAIILHQNEKFETLLELHAWF